MWWNDYEGAMYDNTGCSKKWKRPHVDASTGRLKAMARHYFLSMQNKIEFPELHVELQSSLNHLNSKEGDWFSHYLNEIIQAEK
jgi:hypothetical protein